MWKTNITDSCIFFKTVLLKEQKHVFPFALCIMLKIFDKPKFTKPFLLFKKFLEIQ